MIYNVHNSIHISNDVLLYKNLDAFSVFPFENYLQGLKRSVRKRANPLAQIHRRLCERSHRHHESKTNEEYYPVALHPIAERLPRHYWNPHKSLKYKKFKLTNRKPDNYCFLKDNSVLLIRHICYKRHELVLLGQIFQKLETFSNYPCDSRKLNLSIVSDLTPLTVHRIVSVAEEAMMIQSRGLNYILPLLHI